MNGATTWAIYEDRLRRVSDHIHAHLGEELDLDRLSEIACLSPHHWHRIYRAVHGETLAQTVRRLRLHYAAADLVTTDGTVRQIARRWGYPDLAAFTRLFSQTFGLPPGRYRREGSHSLLHHATVQETTGMYDVTIRTIPALPLIGVAHRGSYMGIGKAFETLYGAVFTRRIFQPGMRMIGIYLDDPDLVAPDALRSVACLTADETVPAEAPLERHVLAGGDYAVLRHKGPYADMAEAYRYLYSGWLPGSGRMIRDSVMFEEYLNNPRDVPPTELLTEIHLPLEPAA